MSWVVVLALIGGCLATPLQQGNLKIVNYRANRDGLFPSDGIPIAPQPIIYNPQQPVVVEPAPLTYGSVDQQRHITSEDDIEPREEGVPVVEEEPKPVDEQPKVDSNVDSKDDQSVRDDQKPVQSETAANLGSSVLNLKGYQPVGISSEELFPSVISGQRRLESQSQTQSLLYGVKGKLVPPVIGVSSVAVPQQRVIYHVQQVPQQIHQQLPIQLEEQRITNQGVHIRRPAVQYQQSVQPSPPVVPREWLRKPIQSGVKGGQHLQQQQIQYFIQPVIPSELAYVSQSGQPVGQPQVVTLHHNFGGVKGGVQQKGQQVGQEEVKVDVPKRQDQDVLPLSQPDLQQQGVQDFNLGTLQGVQGVQGVQIVQQQQQQPQQRHDVKGVKSPVDHSVHRVVVQTSQQQVPVVGQQHIQYQVVGQQQPQQIVVQQPIQQLIPGISQPNVQILPISDIQKYYQLVSQVPIQSIGQQIPITYSVQNPQVIDQYSIGQVSQVSNLVQPVQPIGQQVVQSYVPIEVPVGVSPLSVGGVQGSQRIQVPNGGHQINVQEDQQSGRHGVKGHDLRVNPQPQDQRQQRSFIINRHQGVKGGVSVSV